MPAIVLRAQDLGYAYPQRRLFHQLSFELPAGLSLVRGGDGSGKTTLLRLGCLRRHLNLGMLSD